MKKILILTTNRADYSKLETIINIIHNIDKINMYLVVSGTHLLTDFGQTDLNINFLMFDVKFKLDHLRSCPQGSRHKFLGILKKS